MSNYFFKVPYEILNKKFRTTQKVLDREVSHITQAANEIEKAVNEDDVKAKDITMLLGGMVEKLQVKTEILVICFAFVCLFV